MTQTYWERAVEARLERAGSTDPNVVAYVQERTSATLTVILHLLDRDGHRIHLRVSGLLDDDEAFWLSNRADLPEWLPVGVVFTAQLLAKIETIAQLQACPWAFHSFEFANRPQLEGAVFKATLTPERLITTEGTVSLDWREARLKLADKDAAYQLALRRGTWEGRICLPEDVQEGEESYPLLMAFEHDSGIVSEARIGIQWYNTTRLHTDWIYFDPEQREQLYKIDSFADRFGSEVKDDGEHTWVIFTAQSEAAATSLLTVREFRQRFIRYLGWSCLD